MKQFDRAELEHDIDAELMCPWAGRTERIANALALALAVVDKCVVTRAVGGSEWTECLVCWDMDQGETVEHEPDCPVKACVEKGLTRG